MKASERKIKQEMPFEELPSYLRQLADALGKKADNLPQELVDLPEPIAKLEIKGRARERAWELKIKIKAPIVPNPAPEKPEEDVRPEADDSAKSKVNYKQLKKRMKASFSGLGESLAANKLPAPEMLDTFLADSDLLTAFAGEKYGESHYPAYQRACRRLAEAFEARSWEGFKNAYTALEQLMRDCHNKFK